MSAGTIWLVANAVAELFLHLLGDQSGGAGFGAKKHADFIHGRSCLNLRFGGKCALGGLGTPVAHDG